MPHGEAFILGLVVGPSQDGAVIFSYGAEEYMLGTTYAQLHHDNPKLDKLLVDSMLAMCAQMMAMAVGFYFVIASDFAALGAKDTFMDAIMVAVFAIPAVVGSFLMLVASRGNDRSPVSVR